VPVAFLFSSSVCAVETARGVVKCVTQTGGSCCSTKFEQSGAFPINKQPNSHQQPTLLDFLSLILPTIFFVPFRFFSLGKMFSLLLFACLFSEVHSLLTRTVSGEHPSFSFFLASTSERLS
jgi:hypothetical protein